MGIKKLRCCGEEVGDLTPIKISDKECTIAVYICGVCGRVYEESRLPVFRDGKRIFRIDGKVEAR